MSKATVRGAKPPAAGVNQVWGFEVNGARRCEVLRQSGVLKATQTDGKISDTGGGTLLVREVSAGRNLGIVDWARDVFLPLGYPASVSSDYLSYQLWDTVQALCSSITGVLSTQAVLKGVGVGESTATPVAATLQWIIRDGSGMIGRITFAWMKGSDLDSNCKMWRLVADVVNDLAIMLDLCSAYFPEHFLAIVCSSSVLKAIVGVSGSCTRAALTQHQARRNNLADVSAKDGSQETAVSLLGLLLSLAITPLVSSSQALVWIVFFVFTCLHLYANYRAVSSVVLETLNQARAADVFSSYLEASERQRQKQQSKQQKQLQSPSTDDGVLSIRNPTAVSLRERVVFVAHWLHNPLGSGVQLLFGARLADLIRRPASFAAANAAAVGTLSLSELNELARVLDGERYLLDAMAAPAGPSRALRLVVVLRRDAAATDVIKAYFHCFLCARLLRVQEQKQQLRGGRQIELVRQSYEETCLLLPGLLRALELAGWETGHTHLAPGEWRAVWPTSDEMKDV